MKLTYKCTLIAFLAVSVLGFAHSVWAQSELIVEWETSPGSGNPVVNALRDAIINDTARPADRVYVLRRGGYYHITDTIVNEDFHLRIRGQEADELAPGETDYGKAIIQRVARADGTAPAGTMFQAGDDLTLKNVWVMGITSQGSLSQYEPIQLLGDGERFTFDRVVFDRNDWHHIGANGPNSDFFFTNCIWRNQSGYTQIWEGRGIRFNAGADTVVIENNTMFNVGSIPIQAESATPVNYMRINHNTFVNVGRNIGGNFWKEFYLANNVWVNYQWHGRYIPDINPNDVDPRGTFFGIADLPAGTGTNASRKIVLVNNSWWRDPALESWYPSVNIQAVPFLNDTTRGWFDTYPNMLLQGNYEDVNPGVVTYPLDTPGVLDSMKAHIVHLYGGGGNAPRYWWDPNRDFTLIYDGVYPETVNFTYGNATLLAGGTDGLPLGDLNWYPDKKAIFEANKAQYVAAIENLVVAQREVFENQIEAETGTLTAGAVQVGYNYPVVIRLQEGPSIKWNYQAANAGTYTLRFNYSLSIGTPKGQKIHINSQPYTAGDPDVMFEGPGDGSWLTRDLDVTLAAGSNDIEIIKSWGWMYFGDLEILSGGAPVDTLGTIDAVLTGDVRFEKRNSADPNPPSAWYYVNLPDAGSTVTLAYDTQANAAGSYVIGLVYNAETAQQAEILANGTVFTTLALDATEGAWTVANVNAVPLNATGNTIAVRSVGGGLSLDLASFYRIVTTGVQEETGPETYALMQNYPNPFNPTTTIDFSLGKPSQVKLSVYNLLGQRVATLINGRKMAAGKHTVAFDASKLSSGVYFYRLEAGDKLVLQKKMMFLK